MTLRDKIVAEAMTWIGTPFHDRAMVKGVGVDCAMLLIGVFTNIGMVSPFDVPEYGPQHHLHSREPLLENTVKRFAHRVDVPLPGDVVLYKFGHVHHHAAIVVDWPRIVHAAKEVGCVVLDDGMQGLLGEPKRDVLFYSAVT